MQLADHLGTPRAVTNKAKEVLWRMEGDQFGDVQPQVAIVKMPLRHAGQYHDVETGLFYNYFRYYDPKSGRYLRSDPLGLYDGTNPYVYVHGSPLMYYDPTGQASTGAIVGGAIGGLIGGGLCSFVAPGVGTVSCGALGATEGAIIGVAIGAVVGNSVEDIIDILSDDDLYCPSENAIFASKGNQADTQILQDWGNSTERLPNGKRPNRCDWLEANAYKYTREQVKATAKAWGCRPSRMSKDKKR